MEMTDKSEDSQSDGGETSNYRKSNKPLMEKRRRARINDCLVQLKTLVLQAMRKDNAQYSKLEKADILEMTVKHLRQLQRHSATPLVAMETEEYVSKYRVGFNECANEVVRFLRGLDDQGTEIRTRLLNHLAGCMETSTLMTGKPEVLRMNPSHQQPLRVIVPQHENRGQGQNRGVPDGCHGYAGLPSDRPSLSPTDLTNLPLCNPSHRGMARIPLGQLGVSSHDMQNRKFSHSDILGGDCSQSPPSASRAPHVNIQSERRLAPRNQSAHPYYHHVPQRQLFRKRPDCSSSPYDVDNTGVSCGISRTPSPLDLGSEKLWRPW